MATQGRQSYHTLSFLAHARTLQPHLEIYTDLWGEESRPGVGPRYTLFLQLTETNIFSFPRDKVELEENHLNKFVVLNILFYLDSRFLSYQLLNFILVTQILWPVLPPYKLCKKYLNYLKAYSRHRLLFLCFLHIKNLIFLK